MVGQARIPDAHAQQPRVSVIIPALNAADVLPEQLDALACQTYAGPFEVIVADNGSTDATRQVAEARRSSLPSLRVLPADQRAGPSHARNVGAAHATGDLLLFCDADDVVSPSWIEAMATASRHSSLLAGTGIETPDPHGVDPATARRHRPRRFPFLPWNRSSNLGVHRRVFAELGGFDEGRVLSEDVDFCWRAQLAGHDLRVVDDAFVAYRDRTSPVAAMQRQFRFGRAAPPLYRDFAEAGAPQPTLGSVLRDLLRSLIRLPVALVRRDVRRWLNHVAGGLGRLVGWIAVRRDAGRSGP